MFVRKGIRGALLRTTAKTRRVCEQIGEEGFPCVVVGDRFENGKVSYIYSDSRESSREAVEHLLALGHTRIAMATNVVDDSDHADRVAGYREAIQSAGSEGDPRLILRVPATPDGGTQLIRRLASLPGGRPTAAYIADPMSAVGAMNEALRTGIRIPQDLSIVGFDDGETRFLTHPRMTAVCQNTSEIGREAFAALHDMIAKPGTFEPLHSRLSTRLEIHESTGQCPS
jgi:DNA-binding LacI/PurR family transcriptional regulator